MWSYLVVAVAAAGYLWLEGDRSWLATIFLFGPRWPLLLPAPILALTALLVRPKFLLPITAATLVILGPVMGFHLGWRRLFLPNDPRDLRLITFNVDGHENSLLTLIPSSLLRLEPDVVVFQECEEPLVAPGLWPAGWTARYDGGICLATRDHVDTARVLQRVDTGEQGGTGNAILYRLTTASGPVELAAVHLETPRKGLEPLKETGSVGILELNILVREAGSRRVSRWIREQAPGAIIAGDFNLPSESLIFRDSWDRCTDAFSAVGFGFGWTRVLKHFSARIDHVLSCATWTPLRTEIGPDLGSDHLPLIVDLKRTR
jgi:vancomycin resistance protein VanJ